MSIITTLQESKAARQAAAESAYWKTVARADSLTEEHAEEVCSTVEAAGKSLADFEAHVAEAARLRYLAEESADVGARAKKLSAAQAKRDKAAQARQEAWAKLNVDFVAASNVVHEANAKHKAALDASRQLREAEETAPELYHAVFAPTGDATE